MRNLYFIIFYQKVYFYYYLIVQHITESLTDFIPGYSENKKVAETELKKVEKEKNNIVEKKDNNSSDEINELKKQLEEEKNKNKALNDKIDNLNKTINELKKEIIEIKNNSNYNFEDIIKNLEKKINNKDSQLQKYITQLKSSTYATSVSSDEKLTIMFMSQGNQDINFFAMTCKDSELFVRIEERLYFDYPKFKNYQTFFEVNKRPVYRFKSLKENGIKNSDIINLCFYEENK